MIPDNFISDTTNSKFLLTSKVMADAPKGWSIGMTLTIELTT